MAFTGALSLPSQSKNVLYKCTLAKAVLALTMKHLCSSQCCDVIRIISQYKETKISWSFTLMCKKTYLNINFCPCSACNEHKRFETHRSIIGLHMHDRIKNENTDTLLSIWLDKMSVLGVKIRSWSGLTFTSWVNPVFKWLGLNTARSARDHKGEFKGKQDLLVHLRALVVLGSYCLRLDNPGM